MKEEEYDKFLEESYKLKNELEELEYISPRFLEIINFYFKRYGFGIKNKRPERYIKINNEYELLRKRITGLKEKLKFNSDKIEELEIEDEE